MSFEETEVWVSSKVLGTKNRHVLVVKDSEEKIYNLLSYIPYRCVIIKRKENNYYLVSDIALEYRAYRKLLKKYKLFKSLSELIKFKKCLFPLSEIVITKGSEEKYWSSRGHSKLLFGLEGNVGNGKVKVYLGVNSKLLGEG